MKNKRIRDSILLACCSFLLVSTICFTIGNLIKKQYVNMEEAQFVERATFFAQRLSLDKTKNEESYKTLTSTLEVNEQISIINQDGVTIQGTLMNQELYKIGFDKILSGASYYTSVEAPFFVIVPIENKTKKILGAVVLSESLQSRKEYFQQIDYYMIGSLFFFMFLLLILLIVLNKKIWMQFDLIETMAIDLSQKKYTTRYHLGNRGKISKLGYTLNEVAENLVLQQQQLQHNEYQMAILMKYLVIGVMQLDSNRLIKLMNPAMAEIFNEEAGNLIGHPYAEASKSYGLTRMIERAYRRNKPQNEEIYVYSPVERILDANVIPIPDENGEGMDILVLLYDITAISHLEKIKSDFVANASHELKTPVTALKGFSETLLAGAKEDPERLQQFLEIMYMESSRLDALISDILQLSKLEQQDLPLTLEVIDLATTVSQTLQTLEPLVQQKKIDIHFSRPEQPITINSHKNRLQQILINLITNGIHYSKENGSITIAIFSNHLEEVTLEIIDDGIGIPADEIPRIFERFYRVDKARSRNSGGTGLGMSIVKHLVESLHGEIEVESKLGIGTTIRVIFSRK